MAEQGHSVWEILAGLRGPWDMMFMSLSYLPSTVFPLVKSFSIRTLFSWQHLQPLWFARFWAVFGPLVRSSAEPNVVPLLEGRVRDGVAVPASDAKYPGVGGTVMEIGSGSGNWVSLYANSPDCAPHQTDPPVGKRTRIAHVYGVEPNSGVHGLLQSQINAAGLDDVYEIVPLGIQDLLASGRVEPESVDCIVSVLCLCSIPDGRQNVAELYRCLKPGGRWYVYEHVRVFPDQGRGMAIYQWLVNLIWPQIIGGCNLRRDTFTNLREAGPWTHFDLARPPKEPWFFTLPHIYGILTK